MNLSVINFLHKFDVIDEYWSPKIIAELNGQYIKLAKLKGEFVWHNHEKEDEFFMVIKGQLIMDFRDRSEIVKLNECIIVPRKVDHKPRTLFDEEVWIMLFEPINTKHTGEVIHELTKERVEWI